MARLLHITDTHLLADPDGTVSGWRTQASLDSVLDDAARRLGAVDAVLASGDLVHDESKAGYTRLGEKLASWGVPVCVLPGNHDAPETMACSMPRNGIDVLGRSVIGDEWQVLALNSHVDGRVEGYLGERQLQRLDTQINQSRQYTLVAVHHPPVRVGCAWLDRMRLSDGEALLRLCERHPRVKAIVFGHVHQAFEADRGHFKLYATPSTCRQFQPFSADYAEDDRPPGYRCFSLGAGGRLVNRLYRVPGAREQGRAVPS